MIYPVEVVGDEKSAPASRCNQRRGLEEVVRNATAACDDEHRTEVQHVRLNMLISIEMFEAVAYLVHMVKSIFARQQVNTPVEHMRENGRR